jgi:hypothetical protein
MKRDLFYQQIFERLGSDIDPDIFEACAVDLLRKIYLGLTSMRGGQDAGMDGAVTDFQGEPFPLVTTIQEDVISNLTKSLKSYTEHDRKRKKVILATSQELSAKKKQNLFDRANEFGFTLINVYSREDFTNLLYHHPEWCQELLNLIGKPPVLSVFPKTSRPLLNTSLIGRGEELNWLHGTSVDRLLVGYPGSGKSYLLHRFAVEGGGLFIVDDDIGEIAAGIRSLKPTAIILDDAQVQLTLLVDLVHLRQELGAEYTIIASCWYGDQDKVSEIMNLSKEYVHELGLLTRDQIVEVIKDVGIVGPNELVSEIVNQAEGRPGLAATLTHLCIVGDVREVFLGDVLSRSVRNYFEPMFGSITIDVLAAFSIGGDVGLTIQDVANGYQMQFMEVQKKSVGLAAGGIIWETYGNYLSVHPPALRYALIRDVFFKGALSHPIESFIDISPSLEQTAITLVGAYARKANIPREFLLSILEKANSIRAWSDYAWQGQEEAVWVLENHPEMTLSIAKPALENIPENVIPQLLLLSVGDDRQIHNTPEHPMRLIDDWVKSAKPGNHETIKRRIFLINAAFTWFEESGDTKIGCHALRIGFTPRYEYVITDPGAGNTVTFHRGYLRLDEILEIQPYWLNTVKVLISIEKISWKHLFDIVHEWAFPMLWDVKLPDEILRIMHSFAKRIIEDIVMLADGNQGVLHQAKQTSLDAGLDISITLNQEFEILYPITERERISEFNVIHRPIVRKLAEDWSQREPIVIAKRLCWIVEEAKFIDNPWPNWGIYLCDAIAELIEKPIEWVEAFISEGLSGDLAAPFLKKAAINNKPGWIDLAQEYLQHPTLKGRIISIVLKLENPPKDLIDEVFRNLSGYSELIGHLCISKEIPEKTMLKLLNYEDEEIASAAAYGEWYADPKKEARKPLLSSWRMVVIKSRKEFFIQDVIENDGELALDWLINFIQSDTPHTHRYSRLLIIAVSSLDRNSKESILEIIPLSWEFVELIYHLIGYDLTIYQSLLENERLKEFHLIPLYWSNETEWIDKASLALKKGYSTREIAIAVYGFAAYGFPSKGIIRVGKESNTWREWVDRFEKLMSHENEQIREVGFIGKTEANKSLEIALQREHEEDVFGRLRASIEFDER